MKLLFVKVSVLASFFGEGCDSCILFTKSKFNLVFGTVYTTKSNISFVKEIWESMGIDKIGKNCVH